jgi:hypothetical protein
MTSIPENPDALLTRERLADALTEAGYPIKPKTLATKASRGGGPPYRRFGPRVLYTWGDGLRWAQSRLSAPIGSTSEADAAIEIWRPNTDERALCGRFREVAATVIGETAPRRAKNDSPVCDPEAGASREEPIVRARPRALARTIASSRQETLLGGT